MNILFIVSFLLLTLSIAVGKSFLFTQTMTTEKTSLIGRCRASLEIRNTSQVRLFTRATTAAKTKAQTTSSPRALPSHRVQSQPFEMSKLSITTLFTDEIDTQKHLLQITYNLLDDLYGDMPFIKQLQNPHWQKDLIAALMEEGSHKGDDIDLIDIRPKDKLLASIYYKILKGTSGYHLHPKKGIPPLTDFISVATKRRKPIFFCYASLPVMSAALGKDLAVMILEREEERSKALGGRRVLDEGELISLIRENDPHPDKVQQVDETFLFVKKFITLEALSYGDPVSQVYLYQPL